MNTIEFDWDNDDKEEFEWRTADMAKVEYDWATAPVICTIDGQKWLLGPEADKLSDWNEAKMWCILIGGDLPPIEILFQCYENVDLRSTFSQSQYWSSTSNEFFAWYQDFLNGFQDYTIPSLHYYVRAVRKVPI